MNQVRRLSRWAAVPGFLLLAAAPLYAGVVYEIEVKDHEQSPPKTESMEAVVEGNNLKMGGVAGQPGSEGDMIFRGDSRVVVFVDHGEKTYFEMNEQTVGQLSGEVNSAMSQMQAEMEKMLKDLPPDRRAEFEKMMKGQMPMAPQPTTRPKTELKETGERAKKNGYPCVKYEVWRGGRKISELWVTDWSNITGGKEVAGVFEDMADFMREMMAGMPMMGDNDSDLKDNTFEHMKRTGGFPVVTREFGDDGSLESETTLRSARRQNIDPDAFEPPSGYKRQEMFGP